MYDIKYDNVKKSMLAPIFILLMGLVFLIVTIVVNIYENNRMNSMNSSVMSTSYDNEEHMDSDSSTGIMYKPVYTYYVNDKEYTCTSNISSSNPITDGNKKIYYDSKNPSNCIIDDNTNNIFNIVFIIVSLVLLVIGLILLFKNIKKINNIKYLNTHGKLVKGIPYSMQETNISVNNRRLLKIVITYTLNGNTYTLSSEPRYDNKVNDSDNLVDLLIDENNPKNYYIDFEINRLSGNLPTDYYNMNNTNNMM